MTQHTKQEREMFEAWARSVSLPMYHAGWGLYANVETQAAWMAWQSARHSLTSDKIKDAQDVQSDEIVVTMSHAQNWLKPTPRNAQNTNKNHVDLEMLRTEFEKIFGQMPRACTWTGRAYCQTEFYAHEAQQFDQKFKGFVAGWQARQTVPEITKVLRQAGLCVVPRETLDIIMQIIDPNDEDDPTPQSVKDTVDILRAIVLPQGD